MLDFFREKASQCVALIKSNLWQSQFSAFERRLATAASPHQVPETIKHVVTLENLKEIYHFISEQINKNPHQFESLPPGEAIRFEKTRGKLFRDCQLCRAKDGEYALYLQPDGYLKNGRRSKGESLGSGSFKKVFKAYRIDLQQPFAVAAATIKGSLKSVQDEITQEINLTKNFDSRFVVLSHKGKLFFHQSGNQDAQVQVTLFSPLAISNLGQYLNDHPDLSLKDRKKIFNDILKGVAHLHRQGYVHQDLKLENILMMQESDGKVRAKIIDFGFMQQHKGEGKPTATQGCASPELLRHMLHNQSHFDYKFQTKDKKSLTWLLHKLPIYKQLSRHVDKPHFKNDSWALGQLGLELYDLEDQIKPKNKDILEQSHPILYSLLRNRRQDRLTPIQALAQFKVPGGEEILAPPRMLKWN